MHADPSDKSRNRKKGPLHVAVSGGMELAVSLILGVFAGRKADAVFGTEPALLLVGVAAGFSVGLYLLVRSAKQPSSDRPKRD